MKYKANSLHNRNTHEPYPKPNITTDINRLKGTKQMQQIIIQLCNVQAIQMAKGTCSDVEVNPTPHTSFETQCPRYVLWGMEEAHGSSGALVLLLALSGTWLHGSLIPLLSFHVPCHMKVIFASGKSKRFDLPESGRCPSRCYPAQGCLVLMLGASNLLIDCRALPISVETQAVWNLLLNICYIVSGGQCFILFL